MNIILTGLPRSGTTLCCHLLNKLPNCVALHEPMVPSKYLGLEPSAFLDQIGLYFQRQRASLQQTGTAISKANQEGVLPENPFGEKLGPNGLRLDMTKNLRVTFKKLPATEPWPLVIKQPNMFTVQLPLLKQRFPCFAVLRNPLAVLLSWRSIEARIAQGRVPVAERFDPYFRGLMDAQPDILSRQLLILSYFSELYQKHLPMENVLLYEQLIASGGKALSVMVPSASDLNEPLQPKNTNALYNRCEVPALAKQLLNSEGAWRHFYTEDEVATLRDELLR